MSNPQERSNFFDLLLLNFSMVGYNENNEFVYTVYDITYKLECRPIAFTWFREELVYYNDGELHFYGYSYKCEQPIKIICGLFKILLVYSDHIELIKNNTEHIVFPFKYSDENRYFIQGQSTFIYDGIDLYDMDKHVMKVSNLIMAYDGYNSELPNIITFDGTIVTLDHTFYLAQLKEISHNIFSNDDDGSSAIILHNGKYYYVETQVRELVNGDVGFQEINDGLHISKEPLRNTPRGHFTKSAF